MFIRRLLSGALIIVCLSVLIAAIVAAAGDLRITTAQEDGHLYYNIAKRAALLDQPYYVAAPDHKGPLWMAIYSAALFLSSTPYGFWSAIGAFYILLAIATTLCAWKVGSTYGEARILPAAAAACMLLYLLLGKEDYTQVLFGRNITSFLVVASIALPASFRCKSERTCLILAGASGAAVGLAVQTMPSVAFVVPVVMSYLIFFLGQKLPRSFRFTVLTCGVFLLSTVVSCFSAAIWYYFRGAFHDFWLTWWTYNRFYVESRWNGPLDAIQTTAKNYRLYYSLYPLFLAILVLFLLQMFVRKNRKQRIADLLLLGWFVAEAISVVSTQRFFNNYMIQTFVPTACMVIAMAARYGNKLNASAQITVGSVVLLIFFFTQCMDRFGRGVSQLAVSEHLQTSPTSFIPDISKDELAMGVVVQKLSNSSDFVYIWTTRPQLYSLVDRVPASRYLRYSWLIGRIHGDGGTHAKYALPEFWEKWNADMLQTTPKLIVVTGVAPTNREEKPPPEDSPLSQLLTCAFSKVWESGGLQVWTLSGDSDKCLQKQSQGGRKPGLSRDSR